MSVDVSQQACGPHPTVTPPRTVMQRFGKQIAMSVFCSIIAGAIYRSADLFKVSRFIASGFVHVTGGDPFDPKRLPKFPKLPRIPEEINLPKTVPVHVPSLHKSKEQMETEARLREERQKQETESRRRLVVAQLERLGVPFDSEGSLEKLQVELKEGQEMQRKQPLIERADRMGLHVDPKEPYDVLERRIKEAEADADYQEQVREYERSLAQREELIRRGPNARCPNGRCHYQFRTTRKNGDYRCPRCRGIYTVQQARACWTPPPMPKPPKRKAGVMDRVKGLFRR